MEVFNSKNTTLRYPKENHRMSNIKALTAWHQVLASVVAQDCNLDAIGLMLKGLEKLINGSSGMITIFPPGQSPQTTHHRLLANESVKTHVEAYDNGAYLLDPFYCKAQQEHAEGAFSIKDVAPDDFEKSDFYCFFYEQLGFIDEICLLFQCDDHSIVSISFVRHTNEQTFDTEAIEQLNILYPLLKSIIVKWRQHSTAPATPNLERQLDNALIKFGSSVLTPGECRVLHMILHGYSIKFIAEKLGNSIETIKHHRKNIYIKLDVSSQSELFYLFITALKVMPEGETIVADPLTYLK